MNMALMLHAPQIAMVHCRRLLRMNKCSELIAGWDNSV